MAKQTKSASGDQPAASVNPQLRRRQRIERPVQYYVDGIRQGNRIILAQAITLIESTRLADQQKARVIVEACLPFSGQSFRLGLTGVPGVGKSTFIEACGQQLIAEGKKLAVLAVDPSSQVTGGSILGDKTRMQSLSIADEVFIRPSPARESLGGVAARTREVVLLCEAAGYDFIIIETVGVGQSEVAVHALTDFFLLLLLPSGGDELQGIKRGVVEMADLIAINKADDSRQEAAQQARRDYQRALHLYPPKASGWTAKAVTCSALNSIGIDKILSEIGQYHQHSLGNGYFDQHRQEQAIHWFRQSLQQQILEQFYQQGNRSERLQLLETAVQDGQLSPLAAVEELLK